MTSYEVTLVTPVVVTDDELEKPGSKKEIKEIALDQIRELIERFQDDKHGVEIEVRITKV